MTASISIVKLDVATLWARALSSWMVVAHCTFLYHPRERTMRFNGVQPNERVHIGNGFPRSSFTGIMLGKKILFDWDFVFFKSARIFFSSALMARQKRASV